MTDQDDVLNIATNQGWFGGLSEDDAAKLIDHSTLLNFADKELIYKYGDTQDGLYCLIEGMVKISILSQQGDDFPLAIWETGSWFGEAAFYQESVMPLEASAVNDVKVLRVPISVIDSVLDNGTLFYKNVLLDVLGRAQMLFKLIEMLLFNTLRARLAARILHLLNIYGKEVPDGIRLPLELSQSDFARMSGGSRQRVNIIFRTWARIGVISKQKKCYVVHDIQALRAELEDLKN